MCVVKLAVRLQTGGLQPYFKSLPNSHLHLFSAERGGGAEECAGLDEEVRDGERAVMVWEPRHGIAYNFYFVLSEELNSREVFSKIVLLAIFINSCDVIL